MAAAAAAATAAAEESTERRKKIGEKGKYKPSFSEGKKESTYPSCVSS